MNNKLLVIAGPTGVGKTDLSIKLSKKLNGEVISADSMQIYKYMDIGSAKLTKEEMNDVTHHMIDIILPDEPFTVVDYKNYADKEIEEILNKEVTVEAEDFEQAMKIINKLYRDEEIVLDYDDFVGYTINYINEEK